MANIKVCLDPSHSRQRPGAHFGGLAEEELNLLQADFIKQVLDSVGVFNVTIIDRADDNKVKIGYAAKGTDLFVSLHHNSFDGKGDPYSSVHTHSMGNSPETKLLSDSVAKEFKRHFGVVKQVQQELQVLKSAQAVQVPACILVESYFLQGGYDEDEAIARTKLAGYAIASGIIVYSQRVHTDRYTATRAGTVAQHLDECRANSDRDSEGQKNVTSPKVYKF